MCFPSPIFKRPLVFAAIAVALLASAGCGKRPPPLGIAEGTVTFRGTPLATGSVIFENSALGVSQIASLDASGHYDMKTYEGRGVPPGTYKVAIRPGGVFLGAPPLAEDPGKSKPPEFPLPAKFQSTATSGLEATVAQGINAPFDFKLSE